MMINNNTVTPETALRLKDAGFPQPEIEPGQFWVINDEYATIYDLAFIIEADSKSVAWATNDGYKSKPIGIFAPDRCFVPTSHDLLAILDRIVIRHRITRRGQLYNVEKKISSEEIEVTINSNLAEALALMWEKINNL